MRLSVCLATLSSSCFSSLFSLSKMALPIALNGLPGARTGCTRCFEALLLHLPQQLSLLVGNIFSFPFFLSLSPLSIPPHVAIGFPFVVANVSIQAHWLDQVDEIRCVCVFASVWCTHIKIAAKTLQVDTHKHTSTSLKCLYSRLLLILSPAAALYSWAKCNQVLLLLYFYSSYYSSGELWCECECVCVCVINVRSI